RLAIKAPSLRCWPLSRHKSDQPAKECAPAKKLDQSRLAPTVAATARMTAASRPSQFRLALFGGFGATPAEPRSALDRLKRADSGHLAGPGPSRPSPSWEWTGPILCWGSSLPLETGQAPLARRSGYQVAVRESKLEQAGPPPTLRAARRRDRRHSP